MTLWVCLNGTCRTKYAVGLFRCPRCNGTQFAEDGSEEAMPKITVHGGPTNANAAEGEPGYMPPPVDDAAETAVTGEALELDPAELEREHQHEMEMRGTSNSEAKLAVPEQVPPPAPEPVAVLPADPPPYVRRAPDTAVTGVTVVAEAAVTREGGGPA